ILLEADDDLGDEHEDQQQRERLEELRDVPQSLMRLQVLVAHLRDGGCNGRLVSTALIIPLGLHHSPPPSLQRLPAWAVAAGGVVSEAGVRAGRPVQAAAADQVRMPLFRPLGRLPDDAAIARVDAAVAIPLARPAITVVVDDPVHRVTVYVP